MEDHDNNDKKIRKKKRRRDNNPLAVARAKSKQNKAESLWHKRSGIGYRLFVEYYRHQPVGVVVAVAAVADNHNNNNNSHGHCNGTIADDKSNNSTSECKQTYTAKSASKPAAAVSSVGGGAGQSRAAKKRRKKRQGKQNSCGSQEAGLAAVSTSTTSPAQHASLETAVVSESNQQEQARRRTISDNNHPLLEALRHNGHRLHKRGQNDQHQDHDHHQDAFEEFLVALSMPLPLSFRIRNGISSSVHQELQTFIQEHFSQLVAPMPWNDQIYQAIPLLAATTTTSTSTTTTSNSVLSKSNLSQASPALKQFLQQHSVDGTLARQEVGSMLPVLGLHRGGWLSSTTTNADSSSSSSSSNTTCLRVLDMCASPGSKTLQVLELLQQQQQQASSSSSPTRNNKQPRIIIKANDINATRLETLRQAVERSNVVQTAARKQQKNNDDDSGSKSNSGSSSSNTIKYTNFDASQYPIPTSPSKAYNVILCDVPCSGDGTIRKDGHILPNWTPATSHGLHQLQVNILYRALSCLQAKNGSGSSSGVVCYSTCSLNPIENEAVVAGAILKARQTGFLRQQGRGRSAAAVTNTTSANTKSEKGSPPIVELVDWPEMPSGFIRRPGVCRWKVADYVGDAVDEDDDDDGNRKEKKERRQGSSLLRWHATYQDAVQAQMEHAVPTMWPPPPPLPATAKEQEDYSSSLHLERCVRLLPQDHDTGGFFVALIQRNF